MDTSTLDHRDPIVWDDSLATGDTAIDEDHRHLVTLVQRLADAVEANSSEQIIGDVLCELADHCGAHFNREEHFMKVTRYYDLPAHHDEHSKMIAALTNLIYEFERGLPVAEKTLSMLKSWFRDHTRTWDQRLADYLSQLPEAAKPTSSAKGKG